MEIKVESKNMGTLIIKEVSKEIAKPLIIKNHYSHKWQSAFGVINVGIFKEGEDECLGVAVYGWMMNPGSFRNFGVDSKEDILELNRMWIDDRLGMNAETILISKSFKIIKHAMPNVRLVQSFADGRLGCGTIYKASNFKYFGYSVATFYEDIHTGEITKDTALNNTVSLRRMIKENVKVINNDVKFFKVRSYRYLYPMRKGVLKGVVFNEQPYPEYHKGIEYFERGTKPSEYIRCYIGCFIYNNEFTNEIKMFKDELKKLSIPVELIINTLKTNKSLQAKIDSMGLNENDIIEMIMRDYM